MYMFFPHFYFLGDKTGTESIFVATGPKSILAKEKVIFYKPTVVQYFAINHQNI